RIAIVRWLLCSRQLWRDGAMREVAPGQLGAFWSRDPKSRRQGRGSAAPHPATSNKVDKVQHFVHNLVTRRMSTHLHVPSTIPYVVRSTKYSLLCYIPARTRRCVYRCGHLS